MKINPPGGPPISSGAEGPEAPDKAGGSSKVVAETLDRGRGPGGPGGPRQSDPVADIAADLRAKKITPEQAVERVMEAAIDNSAAAAAPEAMREAIRSQLAELVRDDPFLSSRARGLGAKLTDD